MGNTHCSAVDIADIIAVMIEEYPGNDYDLLRRNCCHFADDFCQRLGVGRIPAWVYRLARIGARIDWVLRPALSNAGIASGSAQSGSTPRNYASGSASVSASAAMDEQ